MNPPDRFEATLKAMIPEELPSEVRDRIAQEIETPRRIRLDSGVRHGRWPRLLALAATIVLLLSCLALFHRHGRPHPPTTDGGSRLLAATNDPFAHLLSDISVDPRINVMSQAVFCLTNVIATSVN